MVGNRVRGGRMRVVRPGPGPRPGRGADARWVPPRSRIVSCPVNVVEYATERNLRRPSAVDSKPSGRVLDWHEARFRPCRATPTTAPSRPHPNPAFPLPTPSTIRSPLDSRSGRRVPPRPGALPAVRPRAPWCRHAVRGVALGCALALSSGAVAPPRALAQQNLPSMGEPADEALSPVEEERLGADFMRQIRGSLPLVRDVRIDEYVQALGNRLALASNRGTDITGEGDFTFFVVDDPQVNAFAIPGGYVGLYVGLIDVMEREEQLAGVVAHEVAHVTQRHHARAFATGQRSSMGAAAAILAALLIGTAASAEAGQAALAAGLAASQQRAINFTRGNEVEADRIGIEILANAAYDPSAMAESFGILRRKNRLNTAGLQLEYLRTHPLDDNRIAEATDRAAGMPHRAPVPDADFLQFKARLAVLTTRDRGELRRTMAARHAKRPSVYTAYGLTMIALQDGAPKTARATFDALRGLAGENPGVDLLETELMEAEGERDGALRRLAELDALYPGRYSIVERRLEDLTDARRLGDAVAVANRYLRDVQHPDPRAWRALAGLREQLGDPAGSHEALARWFEELNEDSRAEGQLELALAQVAVASQDELRLRASLAAVRGRLERVRRR